MPACTMPRTPTTKKDLEYFQRKKVGSIRDNPKLLKIKQRFENGSHESIETKGSNSSFSDSSPSSMSLSKRTGSGVLEELFKQNSLSYHKTEKFWVSQQGIRRHSEGEAVSPNSLSVYQSNPDKGQPLSLELTPRQSELRKISPIASPSAGNKDNSFATKLETTTKRWNNFVSSTSNSSNDLKSKTALSSPNPKLSQKFESRVQIFENAESSAPPIPKRGISPAVKKSLVSPLSLNPSQNCLPPTTNCSNTTKAKSSPVLKTIQMYEGMSTGDTRKVKPFKYVSTTHKLSRNNSSSSHSKPSGISRRPSCRNSLRRSKRDANFQKANSTEKSNVHAVEVSSKEDSGLGSSDAEDRTQAVYQTLSSVTRDRDDTYDRLNRVHDVITRVHKGQISSCAACKTLPPSISHWPSEENSILRVKCHEASPHHHPPCICFSCSHSVFSCVVEESCVPKEEDSLYSNVCCLNSPDHEGWRQSRRRPVCERNGRLCVVNCDIERKTDSCYDRLCEWNSLSRKKDTTRNRHTSKQISGDSCDSDEGWVDVTDSEEEKPLILEDRFPSLQSENADSSLCSSEDRSSCALNSSYSLDTLIPLCSTLDISRCSSTEHLYETIPDVEVQNEDTSTNKSPDGSSTVSLKSEQSPENDLDSGEWSTESASPIFNESSHKEILPKHNEASYQNRFAIQMEGQETAKLNFMKSVLGKKAPTTKRRMSNFFVPWLVVNEYNSTPTSTRNLHNNSSKTVANKKKTGCYPSSKSNQRKAKRTQSTPTNSPVLSRAHDVSYNSVDSLHKLKHKSENTSIKFLDSLCLSPDLSSRSSIASSAYLRTDELQMGVGVVRDSPASPVDARPVEVSVEHVARKSSSGAEHSYILFQPVKEEEVPLYQFYERNVKERVSFCCSNNNLSPVFGSPTTETAPAVESQMRPQISVVEQLSPDAQDMKMLWCELPEVKDSGILERISAQELKLQEAAFEFIQSQASFIRSLKVLYENFIRIPEFSDPNSSSCVLSKHEHDVLFSDIVRVKEVGENLLCEITARWSDGILIPDICDIIHQHASSPSFSIYVRYCSNRVYQERTLKELKETRLCFLEVLRKLESSPICQGLSLESFLFLPMQHIARLPLLLDNMFRWLTPESPFYCNCKLALEAVHKIFMECNEGARKMERLEEMFVLNKQLEFKECKALPLISASRWLLKKGELLKLEFDKKTFGRSSRCIRVPIFVFLFNDLLVVTKRKSDDCYLVVDYCSRDKVQAMAINARDLQHPMVVPNTCRYLIYLTLFNNHQGSAVDMIISCALLSERTRWIEAIHSVPENKPCEVWEYDCPQVQCVRSYIAQQPDELSLQESDVVTIHRKMNDGWYEGRRLRDGLQGWFPASYTMDIPCSRARASNLRQCYRLLMLSHKQ